MAVGYKSATSAGAYTPEDGVLTITTPGAVAAGDVLIAILFSTGGTPAAPDGWSQIAGDGITPGVSLGKAWYRVAGASEPASYDWDVSTTDSTVLLMSAHTGVNTSNPVEFLTWGGSGGAATAQVAPAVEPSMAGAMLVCAWGATGGAGAYTPPSGMDEHADTTTLWQFGAAAHEALDVSGLTGVRTATCNTSTGYLSVSLSLIPADTVFVDEYTVWIDPDGSMMPLAPEWRAAGRFAPPTVREEDDVPGEPGSRLRAIKHAPREFSLALWIEDTDPAALRRQMRDLVFRMDPVRGDGRIRVSSPAGDQREIHCRVVGGLEMSEVLGETSADTVQRAVATFRAVDPYWYWVSDLVTEFEAGDPPSFFPIFPLRLASSEVFVDASVDNPGDVEAWPVWRITGPGTGLVLRNLSTGEVFDADITLASGERVVIDTRPGAKTITRSDGTNLWTEVDEMSWMWALQRGTTLLRIEMTGTTPGVSKARLEFRPRLLTV